MKFRKSIYLCAVITKPSKMDEIKPYQHLEEEASDSVANEPVVAYTRSMTATILDELPYASIENGTLQVTPDIEEEIAEVERGEKVSMFEFKTMFAQWLDQ